MALSSVTVGKANEKGEAVNQRSEAQAPSVRSQLAATWELVKVEDTNGRPTSLPQGPNAVAWMMYHPNGQMCAMLQRTDRPKFASGSPRGGSSEEIRAAFEGFVGYCGTYEVNEADRSIAIHIQFSWLPNWIETDQKRLFEIDGDRLTIIVPPTAGPGPNSGGASATRTVWQRVK